VEIIRAGRGAIITGGSTGIGFATARLLAKEGAKLVLVDLDRDRAQRSADQLISETGCTAAGIGADISEPDQVARMVDEARQNLGQIDIFINSAAIMNDKLFLESEPAEWRRMIDVFARYCRIWRRPAMDASSAWHPTPRGLDRHACRITRRPRVA
jgi:NAD(P)-dependent dehydrogenase (short-subunit alcohol dehydrogenase family)